MPSLAIELLEGDLALAVRETRAAARAPRAIRTGTESADCTARHFGEPGATQQIAPSFFMQKSIAWRHS